MCKTSVESQKSLYVLFSFFFPFFSFKKKKCFQVSSVCQLINTKKKWDKSLSTWNKRFILKTQQIPEFIPEHKYVVLQPWWVNVWECFSTISEDQVRFIFDNIQLPFCCRSFVLKTVKNWSFVDILGSQSIYSIVKLKRLQAADRGKADFANLTCRIH